MIPSAREHQLAQHVRERDAQLRAAEVELGQRRTQVAQLTEQLAAVRAELALLHQGEEPYDDDRIVPTPGQWIWKWNRATPAERLARAGAALDHAEHNFACAMNHWPERAEQAEARIAAVRALIGDLRTWLSPEGITAISVADAIEAAIDGATTSTTVATCGPDCDGGHTYDGQCPVDPQFDSVIGQSTDPQHPGWYWSCEGDESGCEGWFSLDHASAAAARRSYDRHVARDHQTAEARP
jgi:hypothetical protein